MGKSNVWRDAGLGFKLSFSNFLMVALVLGLFVFAIGYSVSSVIRNRASTEVQEKTELLVKLIESADKDLRSRTAEIAQQFHSELSGQFESAAPSADGASKSIPELKLNGRVLNGEFDLVDRFYTYAGSVATVFVRSGTELIRITTSLKDAGGARVLGTMLDHSHPAYTMLLEGKAFSGPAHLFGQDYITQYNPINDGAGQVIGATFVALNVNSYMAELRSTIQSLKVGSTGYFYVLDSRNDSNNGTMLIHPTLAGQNVTSTTDADGQEIFKTMLTQKKGAFVYRWGSGDKGETGPREKLVAFAEIPSFHWIVAGGSYLDELTGEVDRLRVIFSAAGVLAVIVICAVLYMMVRRMVVTPLDIAGHSALLYSQGDLSTEIQAGANDEVGRLTTSMNQVGTELSRVVRSVRTGSEGVATAAEEIAQANHDLSARTESQASALEQTAASMEELNTTVQQNADHASKASELANNASNVAIQGGDVVSKVVETMKHINDSSKKIFEIISVIDGIAFQTNILALNAAVEAARAGEQGRGFAVVAGEVRALAGRSAVAAKEIKGLINTSMERINSGNELADQAGETMSRVIGSIQSVSEIMGQISAASSEQSLGVAQVGEAVIQMDRVTQQNSALVEQMAAAASSLKSQAQDLVQVVSVFKLSALAGEINSNLYEYQVTKKSDQKLIQLS